MISSLRPKSFPVINLSNFKMSESSVSSTTNKTFLPDYSHVKFMNKENPMPNLFQYNDREKLILSSDEEQEQQPSFYFEEKKSESKHITEFKTDNKETVKKSKKSQKEQQQSSTENQLQSKYIKLIKVQNKKQQRHEIPVILQERQENEERKVVKKQELKVQPQSNNNTLNKIQSNISQIVIIPSKIEGPVVQKQQKIQPRIPELLFPTSQKIYQSESIKRQQQTVKKSQYQAPQKKQMPIVEYQRYSKTQSILERIQSDKHSIKLLTESQHKNDTLQNIQEPQNLTPRKRKRNKIFDKSSIRRQPSIFNSQKTPQKGVQTVEPFQKQVKRDEEKSKDVFPQIKALNILDKLVDQIGNQNGNQRQIYNNREKEQTFNSTEFINFNKQFSNEILALQKINCITEINQSHIEQRIQSLQKKIQKWNEQLQRTPPFLINNQICNKFNRLNELFSLIMIVIAQYKQTCLRLELFQKKLEDYVIILRDKDTRRLYLLRRDLNIELECLNQLKAGCGKSKFQKMFSEYLSTEIKLLEEIKEGIDDNFNTPSTIFKF